MPSKKAPDNVYVVTATATINYSFTVPTIQGIYADVNSATEAAAGCGGQVTMYAVNYTPSANTASIGADAKGKAKTPKAEKDVNGESTAKRASSKTVIPDGVDGSLDNLKLAFTGTFSRMDHKTCEAAAKKYGGEIVTKLAESDFVVLGTKPGPKKLEEINNDNLSTLTEEEFYEKIGADFEPPAKKAKKA